MLDVLGEAALRTLLLTALVKFGLALLRIKRARLLLTAWTVILAASLAMPALQWATPLRLAVLLDLPSTTLAGAFDASPQSSVLEPLGPALPLEVPEPATVRPWLEAAYLLVSSILLLRLTVGIALSLRLLGEATPIRLDGAASARVRISRSVATPVTVANVILLPADAADWPSPMRRAVLAHEQAHVARCDFAMLLLSQVNRAVFWFSPLSWWLHRRLAALAELASDDHAMEVTGDRPGYAAVLLEMGRRPGPVLRELAMARRATVRYRIERILSDCVSTTPVSPAQQVVLAIGAVGLSIAVASSALESAPPADVTTPAERQQAATPPNAAGSVSAQAAEDVPEPTPLPQQRTELAAKAPERSPVPAALARTFQSRPIVRTMTRLLSNPIMRTSLAAQPSRVMRPISHGQVAAEASPGTRAVNAESTPTQASAGPESTSIAEADGTNRQSLRSHAVGSLPASERPVLKLINNRTCTGVYLPQRGAGSTNGETNIVRTTLFQDASGTSWLTFFIDGQTPVIQPVTVTHGQDKLTALRDTIFTMVPRSARHLDGFIKHPNGTIDFDCGGSSAQLFDGGS